MEIFAGKKERLEKLFGSALKKEKILGSKKNYW
jgi:hypothetical protein